MLPLKMKKSIYFLAEIESGRPGGACVVSGAENKNHLIEAAPFSRLDQM